MSEGKELFMEQEITKSKKSEIREIIESLIFAVALALVLRLFIFEPFFIPTGSMEPTLLISDHIIVNKIGYRIFEPDRGDIVVFRYPRDPSKDFIKRVVGMPGETVELKDSKLYVNGSPVKEDYLPAGLEFFDFKSFVVPPESYLMLGDNRNNSADSREWGALPRDMIIGKATFIYWPLDRMRFLVNK